MSSLLHHFVLVAITTEKPVHTVLELGSLARLLDFYQEANMVCQKNCNKKAIMLWFCTVH